MHAFQVASGIIVDRGRLVVVQNQRRNGSLDWSTPGGVVDPGEQVLQALEREVREETALMVSEWSGQIYNVQVDFVDRDLSLDAKVFGALGFAGELHVDDPDQVVVDGRWVNQNDASVLLQQSPRWVAEPLSYALGELGLGQVSDQRCQALFGSWPEPVRWRYRVATSDSGYDVTKLVGPDPTG